MFDPDLSLTLARFKFVFVDSGTNPSMGTTTTTTTTCKCITRFKQDLLMCERTTKDLLCIHIRSCEACLRKYTYIAIQSCLVLVPISIYYVYSVYLSEGSYMEAKYLCQARGGGWLCKQL